MNDTPAVDAPAVDAPALPEGKPSDAPAADGLDARIADALKPLADALAAVGERVNRLEQFVKKVGN